MNINDIVKQWLEANGYDGLFFGEWDCGCENSNLYPCGERFHDCVPAYRGPATPGDGAGKWSMYASKEAAEAAKAAKEGEIMEWKCLVCEQPVEVLHPGDDATGRWPNIVGGTMEIDGFAYCNAFDECTDPIIHQAVICTACFTKRQHLTRRVRIIPQTTWTVEE